MNLASSERGHVKIGHARGFTIIELLVVIAIIGILSAVVLASLSTARSKGKDASAEESMSGLRAQNEIYYGGAGANSYGAAGAETVSVAGVVSGATGACGDVGASAAQAGAVALLTSIAANAGHTANCRVGVNGATWEADVQLNSQTGLANFCADSSGFAGTLAAAPASTVTTKAVSCN